MSLSLKFQTLTESNRLMSCQQRGHFLESFDLRLMITADEFKRTDVDLKNDPMAIRDLGSG